MIVYWFQVCNRPILRVCVCVCACACVNIFISPGYMPECEWWPEGHRVSGGSVLSGAARLQGCRASVTCRLYVSCQRDPVWGESVGKPGRAVTSDTAVRADPAPALRPPPGACPPGLVLSFWENWFLSMTEFSITLDFWIPISLPSLSLPLVFGLSIEPSPISVWSIISMNKHNF